MIQFKIELESKSDPRLYEDYCRFIFERVNTAVSKLIDERKYRVREKYILESPVIKWTGRPPKHINLSKYVKSCLTMTKVYGDYVIHINGDQVIPGSTTKVSTLVRLLEYGNEKLPPYPVVRRVLLYYSRIYPNLILEFMKARLRRNESVSLRRSTRRKVERGARR